MSADAQAEAREQIARWLAKEYGDEIGDGPPGYWDFQARELITDCSAVALVTDGDRLRECIEASLARYDADPTDGLRYHRLAGEIRAALGGDR